MRIAHPRLAAALAVGVTGAAIATAAVVTASSTAAPAPTWADSYSVLSTPQSATDVFRASSALYEKAATDISKTSRYLGKAEKGDVYAFQKDGALCLLWRDAENGVATNSCREIGEATPPSVTLVRPDNRANPILVTMVPDGTAPTLTAASGEKKELNVSRNLAVHQGQAPYTIDVTVDGKQTQLKTPVG